MVIGILIALQLNNQKEIRDDKNFEIEILKEIRTNLKADFKEITHDLGLMEDLNKACISIRDHLTHYDEPTDSLIVSAALLRLTPHFSPITSGYTSLQARGVKLIINDSLRNAILHQYDMLYPYYHTYEEERSRFHALNIEPQIIEYFEMNYDETESRSYLGMFFHISQDDYLRLQKDPKFPKLLKAISFENTITQDRGKQVQNSIQDLIRLIDQELKKIE